MKKKRNHVQLTLKWFRGKNNIVTVIPYLIIERTHHTVYSQKTFIRVKTVVLHEKTNPVQREREGVFQS